MPDVPSDSEHENCEGPENSEPDVLDDPEIQGIMDKASSDLQPHFEFPSVEEEEQNQEKAEEEFTPGDVQDPVRAYKLYYNKKERLLRNFLPSGDRHKEARSLIREQVNLYLKEGHETGRDGRQAYHFLLEDIVVAIQNWVESGGTDLFELYATLRSMNKEADNLNPV